jgi:hypothetical protein
VRQLVNFVLLALAGILIGAGLRARKVGAPRSLAWTFYFLGLVSLTGAIVIAIGTPT